MQKYSIFMTNLEFLNYINKLCDLHVLCANMVLNGMKLETVQSFIYLGSKFQMIKKAGQI